MSARPPSPTILGMLDSNAMGLRPIEDTTFAVIDLETTGFIPGADRIVELAVVRVEPGGEPQVVMETLINPQRPVAASEVHGIVDADVANAPPFGDVAGDVVEALADCCVVSYNAGFDLRILHRELRMVGVDVTVPHLCLMYLREDLNIGPKGPLEEACRFHGVPWHAGHRAAYDALSEAELLIHILPLLAERRLTRVGDVLHHSQREYCQSLVFPPLGSAEALGLAIDGPRLRRPTESEVPDTRQALGLYEDALLAAVADLVIDDTEIAELSALRQRYGLRREEIRGLHARLFGLHLSIMADDRWVSDDEAQRMGTLMHCLRTLGWAPGD